MTTKRNEVFSWIRTILFAVIIAFLIRAFLFTNYIVEGDSMLPTMHHGDRLVVNKLVYKLYEPERFDVIVFHATSQADYIKRIIGLPGDHIEYKNDVLYINGEPYDEPFLDEMKMNGERLTHDFTLQQIIGKETVPENTVFVLGDNRRNSTDSRNLGVIPFDQIVGEVNVKYWPFADLEFYH
ncbi:signal peptidase I [Pueribacillus sp. YX66]|uniref:signal peptidase I n=1 Tax=Pueribacillus sp. YX66 TaxID=3229242 RepID=UPI00358D43CC